MIEKADSPMVTTLHGSPNIEPRKEGMAPSILILHYTGLPTLERSLDVLSRPDCKVSCHYVIDTDGRIIQMVAENMRAWHAGVSSWAGETDINSASIGIEIQNAGHQNGYPEFPDCQMQSVIALSKDIVTRHRIAPARVLAHSDIAPQRKVDPGEKFDWGRLHREGVGHWVAPEPLDPADTGLGIGAQTPMVGAAQALLAQYGYGLPQSGIFDAPLWFVLRGFQLHFRPARANSRLDKSTFATLERLVGALPPPLVG